MSKLVFVALVAAVALVSLSGTGAAHVCIDSPVAYMIEDFDHSALPAAPHVDLDPAVAPDCS